MGNSGFKYMINYDGIDYKLDVKLNIDGNYYRYSLDLPVNYPHKFAGNSVIVIAFHINNIKKENVLSLENIDDYSPKLVNKDIMDKYDLPIPEKKQKSAKSESDSKSKSKKDSKSESDSKSEKIIHLHLGYFKNNTTNPEATPEEKKSMKGVGRKFLNFALNDIKQRESLSNSTIFTLDAVSSVRKNKYKDCSLIYEKFNLSSKSEKKLLEKIKELNKRYYNHFIKKTHKAKDDLYSICETMTSTTEKETIYKNVLNKDKSLEKIAEKEIKELINKERHSKNNKMKQIANKIKEKYSLSDNNNNFYISGDLGEDYIFKFLPLIFDLYLPEGRMKKYLDDICDLINNVYLIENYEKMGFERVFYENTTYEPMISTIGRVLDFTK